MKTKSSMFRGTSSSSAKRRKRYLKVSAKTKESILGGGRREGREGGRERRERGSEREG